MKKRTPPSGDIHLTAAELKRMTRVTSTRPTDALANLAAEQERRGRGPQKAPTKRPVSLRLSRSTLETYRATGRGWQSRISDDLDRLAKRMGTRKRRAS